MKTYQNYIGGEWTTSSSKKRVPNINPADTRDVLGETPMSTRDEAAAACAVAAEAFRQWRRVPAPRRGAIVSRAAQLMQERRDTIARALAREEGKLLSEAQGEMNRSINVAEFSGAHGRRLSGQTIPLELANNFGYTIRVPRGVAALITPWNFPVAIPVWKIAPALVAGNSVVFKPSPLTPETSGLVVQCFADAGLPDGVLNMVHGDADVGTTFIDHPAVKCVSFTGSTPTGMAIYAQAARRGIAAQCEMGGKNPVIVLEDADLDLAVAGVVSGAFGSTGQRCTATSRVILVHPVADAFLERLTDAAAKLRLGSGLDADVDIGPIVSESQLERVLSYIDIGRGEGAELLCGGQRASAGALANGYFVEPTVFDRVRPEMRIAQEEIFGPVLSVIRVENFDEAMAAANDSPFGLTSSIYTRDAIRMFRYIDEIETGMTHVNSPTLGGEAQVPFGGTKATAVGPTEQGTEVFDFYTETKVVYVDYTGAKREGKLY
ncbi:aldehyde dehydrogenase family protein [Kouleothrix sp.]|uniref:aldehyde dehydrogenase family protein n=1 Tax=Kouleothrix sp. TaxID=2779161 RepID=UPI003918B0FA